MTKSTTGARSPRDDVQPTAPSLMSLPLQPFAVVARNLHKLDWLGGHR